MYGNGYTSHYDGYHAHQFDQDVQAGAGSIFERIPNGIADYGSPVIIRALTAQVPGFNIFFRIVPCPA